MTALELHQLHKRNALGPRATHMAADQHDRVARKMQMRMVTTMLLNSTANVLGHNEPPTPHRSLAGMLNGVTRWQGR